MIFKERLRIPSRLAELDAKLWGDKASWDSLQALATAAETKTFNEIFFSQRDFLDAELAAGVRATVDPADASRWSKISSTFRTISHTLVDRNIDRSQQKLASNVGEQIWLELQTLDSGEFTTSYWGKVNIGRIWNYLNSSSQRSTDGDRHAHRYMALLQYATLMARAEYWQTVSTALSKQNPLDNPLAGSDPDLRLTHPHAAAAMDTAYAFRRAAMASVCAGDAAGKLGLHWKNGIHIVNDDGGTEVINVMIAPVIRHLARLGPDALRNALKGRPNISDSGSTIDGRFSRAFENGQDQPFLEEAYRLFELAYPVALQQALQPLFSEGKLSDEDTKQVSAAMKSVTRFHEAISPITGLASGEVDLVLLMAESLDPELLWEVLHALTSSEPKNIDQEVYGRAGNTPLPRAHRSQRWQAFLQYDKGANFTQILKDAHAKLAKKFEQPKRALSPKWFGRWKVQAQSKALSRLATETTLSAEIAVDQQTSELEKVLRTKGLQSVIPELMTTFLPTGESTGALMGYALLCEKYGVEGREAREAFNAIHQLYDANLNLLLSRSEDSRVYAVELAISTLRRLEELRRCSRDGSGLALAFDSLIALWNSKFAGVFARAFLDGYSQAEKSATIDAVAQERGSGQEAGTQQADRPPTYAERVAGGLALLTRDTAKADAVMVPTSTSITALVPRMMRILPESTLGVFYDKLYSLLDDSRGELFAAEYSQNSTILQAVSDVIWLIMNGYENDTVASNLYDCIPTPSDTVEYRRELTLRFLGRVTRRFSSKSPTAIYDALHSYGLAVQEGKLKSGTDLSVAALTEAGVSYPVLILLWNAFRIVSPDSSYDRQWFIDNCRLGVQEGILRDSQVTKFVVSQSVPEETVRVAQATQAALLSQDTALQQSIAAVLEAGAAPLQFDERMYQQGQAIAVRARAIVTGLQQLGPSQRSTQLGEVLTALVSFMDRMQLNGIVDRSGAALGHDSADASTTVVSGIITSADLDGIAQVIAALLQSPSITAAEDAQRQAIDVVIGGQLASIMEELRVFQALVKLKAQAQIQQDGHRHGIVHAIPLAQLQVTERAARDAARIIGADAPDLVRAVNDQVGIISVATQRLFGLPLSQQDTTAIVAAVRSRAVPLFA